VNQASSCRSSKPTPQLASLRRYRSRADIYRAIGTYMESAVRLLFLLLRDCRFSLTAQRSPHWVGRKDLRSERRVAVRVTNSRQPTCTSLSTLRGSQHSAKPSARENPAAERLPAGSCGETETASRKVAS
jgi:hypothetical protein